MKLATHLFNTIHGQVKVDLEIHPMDACEAIDVYDQPADLYFCGGYRIEGMINGTPRGTVFSSGNLGSVYRGGETEPAARHFLAGAHQEGFFTK
ncbi:MAG: hypothetical protein CVU31_02600 [Betaproteobacteria bacterium HGW-Betaproteobacteria-4]|jgi:hypothetical protein|nr:MAG: hypothetical protein CVU31_02600 [Betaproteobacteria bacterium HGW-Betaproteobacteria-4]